MQKRQPTEHALFFLFVIKAHLAMLLWSNILGEVAQTLVQMSMHWVEHFILRSLLTSPQTYQHVTNRCSRTFPTFHHCRSNFRTIRQKRAWYLVPHGNFDSASRNQRNQRHATQGISHSWVLSHRKSLSVST